MARAEGERTAAEKIGRGVLYTGLVIAGLGLIDYYSNLPIPGEPESLAKGGLALGAAGVIVEFGSKMITKKK